MDIDKTLVKRQFDCDLNTYNDTAVVQKQIAKKLIQELALFGIPAQSHLFEVGCGTGFLTQEIMAAFEFDELIVNDISTTAKLKIQELSKYHSKPIHFMEGDAEEIDFPKNLNALISSSTIQWFNNKKAFFNKVHQSLKANGVFAFSTFGCDNFKEIKSLTGVGLNYHCLDELTEILSDQFNIIKCNEWVDTKIFDSPLDVLRHIKQTGVNGIQKTYFGKKELKKFTVGYNEYFSNKLKQVTLSYNPIIIIAQKK